jgi:23S rRNA-/tRNA-specific pseudouridylate synthase
VIDHSGTFQVPLDAARIRLDRYLSELFPDQSRSQIQGWIRNGGVQVNRAQVKTGYLLRPGDSISIEIVASSPEALPQPENIPLKVIHEDEDLAVVDKPAGLVCHAGAGVRSGTLVNALLYHLVRCQPVMRCAPALFTAWIRQRADCWSWQKTRRRIVRSRVSSKAGW